MEWINELLWGEGVGHSILLLSVVIALGIQLGKLKLFGISLGITMVLFVGIFLGHFGFTANPSVVHFFREFGLILFVYSVGMQVGPGFFSSKLRCDDAVFPVEIHVRKIDPGYALVLIGAEDSLIVNGDKSLEVRPVLADLF